MGWSDPGGAKPEARGKLAHFLREACQTLPIQCADPFPAQEATEALKPILGEWYKRDERPIFKACWEDWSLCRWAGKKER